MLKKIPNILTIGRIIIVPFFVLAFYLPGFYGDLTALILFIIASFTDFLDGMLARMFGGESKLGELLDPIADKILIVFILIGLSVDLDSFLIAFLGSLIIAREIGVSALRDYSSRNNKSHKTKVTYLAKIKTSVQLFSIGLYLFALAFSFNLLIIIGDIFLITATLITIYTGYEYTFNVFKK